MEGRFSPPLLPRNDKDLTPELAVDTLSRDLLRDYYQSFRLAQSELAVQPALFRLLAVQHRAANHQAALPEALERAGHAVEHLMPPAHHTETTEQARNDQESGFQAVWNNYVSILRDPNADPDRPLALLLDDMLVEDLKYQDKPRPNRSESQDQHESIVREYILGDRLTGSRQLQEVRDKLRSTLLFPENEDYNEWMLERLHLLIERWEANHPGQVFMPSASGSE